MDCIFDNNAGHDSYIYISGDNNEINNCKICSNHPTHTWVSTEDPLEGGGHWVDLYPYNSVRVVGKNNVITNCLFSPAQFYSSAILVNNENNTVKNCLFNGITGPMGVIYIDSKKIILNHVVSVPSILVISLTME
ncbi:hypothetical protein [uncultured Methanobrevibacter sp.]|uniref:hypothetical protein n=1 Tax=uncultured Methanobrevibacter sp. TaxID=253161 RepID=UPI0025FA4893|nr:hypothetical protein [uncultured Methanobrevibacter sp.]